MSEKPWRDEELMRELYHDKRMSQREISDYFDNEVTPGGIGYCLDELGIEKRTRVEAAEIRWSKTPLKLTSHHYYGHEVWREASGDKEYAVYVHRLLAVAEYGFEAVADMDVHHKNEIPWDNRPENIELLSRSDHVSLHSSSNGAGEEGQHT